MGQRLVAVVVVVASACTALHYSTTSQQSVGISNNPYQFSGPGSASFIVSAAGSSDHDILQDVYLDNCDSQWMLYLDPMQPLPGAHVCGFGAPNAMADLQISCPRTYQFLVGYAGNISGTSSCNVQVVSMDYNGSGSSLYTLFLTGSGSGATGITVSPNDINFGDVQIAASGSDQVDVKNNGSAAVQVAGTVSGSGFSVSPSPASFSIGPGATQTFYVFCTPAQVGPMSGQLDFTTPTSNGQTKLMCNGIDSNVTIAPSLLRFDNTLVGNPPAPKTVTISGGSGSTIQSVTLDADATAAGVTIAMNPQGMPIGSGQNVVLGYDAAMMHPAGPLGVLSIVIDTEPMVRTVSLSGQALLGGVGTNPAGVELGAVCVGDSVTKDVEVYASEAGDVVLKSFVKPAAPFDATVVDPLPRVLAGNHTGASATVRVTLAPAVPGDFRDAFALSSNVPSKPTTEVQLHGVAVAAGIAATPDEVHFGTTAPNTTTSIKEVQLTNCGTTELMFNRVTIAGANAGEFTLIGTNAPRTLLPTESEVFMVVMQPETAGYKTAELVIEHGAGTTVAALDGTGEGGNDKDRETYYACQAGRGGALWPIVLALGLLRRRRRR